jgi:hypothetical protein
VVADYLIGYVLVHYHLSFVVGFHCLHPHCAYVVC